MAYSIVINRSNKQLTLYQNGRAVQTYSVGVGKFSTPTPVGHFRIVSKVPNPGGPFGAMWLGLSQPHYGIHGTNNPASIGYNVSHGCVRMQNSQVLALARVVPVGTPVMVQ